jgi:serine/threonine-protein kinase
MPLPDGVPEVAALALVAAGRTPLPDVDPTSSLSHTTAAAAMRDEEVERTRLFIRMGWVLSVAVIATVPFVQAPFAMSVALVAGLVIGMIVSFGLHRAFADPQRYTESALMALAVICCVNGHIAVMYYGAFSAAPLVIMVGIHFVARTEAVRVARWILAGAVVLYSAIAAMIISGAIDDPGVFASNRAIDRGSLVIGTVFVLGTFALAYETARMFRLVSLAAIEDLQRATRLASEREALMDELRADLERALRIGGPGRYTDQTVGKYKLGVVLGRGAIGEVYDALHVDTGEPAAVKLLRRELLADPTQVARFLREARASSAIDSPHVVRVLGASEPDAALPFLAAERLTGHTLSDQLRKDPRLTGEALVELCRHVASGLDAAAAANIVHRDLKPQNLMHDGVVWKILDFGVATFAEDSGVLTRGEAIGTPHYMPPEQAQGKAVDAHADLYALGAIAYRCLTGRYLYQAADTAAMLYAIVHKTPTAPSALASLPPDIDRWCAIALAKSPGDRFASGRVLADALSDALRGALSDTYRNRGDALIRKHPWGTA